MRKAIKLTAMLLAALMVGSGLSACKDDGGGDVSMDSDGNVRPGADGPTKITFWGYGDDNEISVFQQLVKDFNAVSYTHLQSTGRRPPRLYRRSIF